jgi:hypothetical protein
MSKALSVDLRVRVLEAVATGATHREAADRFAVSAASVSRWRKLEREQGDPRPKALGGDRVLDHDHLSGDFRGVAHKACNLNYGYRHYKLPVFFHNLAGYDAHFLLQRAGAFARRMTCLAKTAERMVSFSIGLNVFKDSLQFMGKALATCVDSLGPNDFRVHDAEFAGESDELRALRRANDGRVSAGFRGSE